MTEPRKATLSTTDPERGRWRAAAPGRGGGVARHGQVRWFGLDGVEHAGGPLVDFDGQGRPDDRLFDTDGDGMADRVVCSGPDGVTGYIDTDGDGLWNLRLTDIDGDGSADGAATL